MTEPRAFTTITQTVTALQWDGSAAGLVTLRQFLGTALIAVHDRGWLSIMATGLVAGQPVVQRGQIHDWVVKGADGRFRLLPPAVFDELYVETESVIVDAAEPLEADEAPSADVAESVVDPTLADA